MTSKPTKIESQTYRIGDYVIFQTDKRDWKMGTPLDWEEPLGGGLLAGTVSYHRTLKDAKRRHYRERRAARMGL